MFLDLEFNYDEAAANMDKFCQDDIDFLRQWIKNLDPAKCVPKDLTDKQILIFYNACETDVERTKTCVEKYYSYRKNGPELFDNRVVDCAEVKPSVEALEFSILPGKSVEGYDVIFHRLYNTEPTKYQLDVGCKLLFIAVDACLNKRGPQPGYIFLFDMRGVKLGHITRISLSTLRKFFQYVQEAMPVRMKAIHVMNTEPVLDKVLLLIRPFMDKKFYDMLRFHNKNEDLTEFHEKVIPRSSLPPDYGGTLQDTQTLHKKCMQHLITMEPYFQSEEEQRKNAIGKKNNVTTSFKKLEID